METLCRKLKNNPLLIGKPGVGKTALVAAVATRLSEQAAPPRLRGKRILAVSRLKLLADAKFAGETEERVKSLIEEVQASGDVILFFDEIHLLLSAGGPAGTGDIASLLKSSLSRGDITCIGATTLAEYYKHIARDEALARRFSAVRIEEPSLEETRRILAGSRHSFEAYHGVTIDDEAIELVMDIANRYLPTRGFPDKGLDLMDNAAAKASLSGHGRLTPGEIMEALSEMTGLPLEVTQQDPSERLDRLEELLNSAAPGQIPAAHDVARVIRIAKLGFEVRPEKPDGVFLFVGPDGVGKTEMVNALAQFLYGSPGKVIEFDLGQFAQESSMARLIGAEPGYVGYGERGGLLSKALQDNPHSVLFFHNVDLAHFAIQQFLSEALDHGRFVDASGEVITLSHATVVLSLSQGSERDTRAHIGFFAPTDSGGCRRESGFWARSGLIETLSGVVDEVVEFHPLDREAVNRIIALRVDALRVRVELAQPVLLDIDPAVVGFFANRLAGDRFAVEHLDRSIHELILVPLADLTINRAGAAEGIAGAAAAGPTSGGQRPGPSSTATGDAPRPLRRSATGPLVERSRIRIRVEGPALKVENVQPDLTANGI